jgi:hypothetical protein
VCLGGGCTRVGGVEALDLEKDRGGSGGEGFIAAGGSSGWHQRLHWGGCFDCRLNDY